MTNQVSRGTSHHKEIGQDGSSKDGLCEEWFDAHTLGPDLMVRTWQPGDRFQPLGMAQEKKLQDFFVDQKVPRRQRQRIPLLVASDERIAWVIGQRIAEPFKVTSKSAAVLRVVCEHDDSDRPK